MQTYPHTQAHTSIRTQEEMNRHFGQQKENVMPHRTFNGSCRPKKKKIKQKKISHNDVTKWQRTHIPLQPVCVFVCNSYGSVATAPTTWAKKKIGNSFMSRIVKNIISIFYVCRRRHVVNMVLRFYCFVAPPNTPRILRCWNVGIFGFWQLNQPKVPSLFFKWQRELGSKGEQIPSICVAYACICLYILNLNRDRSVSYNF